MLNSGQIRQGSASGTLVIVLVPLGQTGSLGGNTWVPHRDLQNIYRQLSLLLVVHKSLMVRPCCWTQPRFGHRTWRSKAGTHQEASTLWASFHRIRRCSLDCWKRKVANHLNKLWNLWVRKMTGKARYAHRYNSAMVIMGATDNFWLDLRPLPQEEMCVW